MTCPVTYRLWLVAILYGISFANRIHGQGCGVITTEPAPEKFFNTAWLSSRTDVIDTVGLAVWVIRDTFPVDDLYEQLETSLIWVNEKFEAAGLYFRICEWTMENGQGLFSPGSLQELNAARFQDHRINLYLVQQLTINGQSFGGIGYFPWTSAREERFVAIYQEGIASPELIAHEFGHYYGLYHTHETQEGRELVLRSNCHRAGDLCCDTPADPGLGYHNMDGCQYIGGERDLQGYFYAPLTDYIMSYAPLACVDRFSAEQYARMRMTRDEVYPLMANDCQDLPDIALNANATPQVVSFLDIMLFPVTLHHTLPADTSIDITLFWENEEGKIAGTLHTDIITLTPEATTVDHTLRVALPQGIQDAMRTIRVKADGNRQLIESDERNNEASFAIAVDNSRFSDAMVFPNPAEDEITLFFRRAMPQDEIQMRMTNTTGLSLGDPVILPMLSPHYTQLSVDHLVAGMYFLYFMTGENVVAVVPFVKL